jgi:hypothetical protein
MAAAVAAVGLVLASASPAYADPSNDAVANPYPSGDLIFATYDRADPDQFFIPGNYGVFFMTPSGLNCGIWIRGNFGCSGSITGAPPGVNHIGWFNGDTTVHFDLTAAIQFPNVQAQQVLQPRSYVNWNETTCVTMADTSTYCMRGTSRFLITDHGTWLSPSYAPQSW